jgi:uncharacterized phiE125 gp8 family phage protein
VIYQLQTVTPPVEKPILLDDAKLHLRVDGTEEDALIQRLIDAAIEETEKKWLWRALCTRSLRLTNIWGSGMGPVQVINLPMAPVQSVSLFKVDDVAVTGYTLFGEAAVLYLDTARTATKTMVVEYVAGYGTAAAVPANFKAAMLLMIGHWFENREAVTLGSPAYEIPLTVQHLLLPFRAWRPPDGVR